MLAKVDSQRAHAGGKWTDGEVLWDGAPKGNKMRTKAVQVI